MASGDDLATLGQNDFYPPPSGTAAAQPDVRNGHPIWDFDAATEESIDTESIMPATYDGGGIYIDIYWMASTATSGTCRWLAQLERHQEDAQDLDSDGFASAQSAEEAPASAAGEIQVSRISFTDGAQMDSVVAGDHYRLRVARDSDHANDTMSGDAEVIAVRVIEQ